MAAPSPQDSSEETPSRTTLTGMANRGRAVREPREPGSVKYRLGHRSDTEKPAKDKGDLDIASIPSPLRASRASRSRSIVRLLILLALVLAALLWWFVA